jgi:glutamate synthase (NADPH) small chain
MAKVNLNRVEMPRQDPAVRGHNFSEVALGYTHEQAIAEAGRCLQCKKRNCTQGCPVEVDIPEFIKALLEGNLPEAVKVLKAKNSLPGVCGRVCPQESQCESTCVMNKQGFPIAIGRLERFVADWEITHKNQLGGQFTLPVSTAKQIAVVGSGPSGLAAAADLAKMGHQVTIFEALHVAGGVLTYGIPEFRLPKNIVRNEVDYIASLGVKIKLDSLIGKLKTVDELLSNGYHAVFLGTGAGLPTFLYIPGENLNGIYSANEYLTRVNLMLAYKFPEFDTPVRKGKNVAVIGGGNVAMDSARCALRMGAEKVYIVYRRTEKEMPARREELENAKEEGIIFKILTYPKQFIGDDKGSVKRMACFEVVLGELDESGRRRPVIKTDSELVLDVDLVIVAVGTTPNPLIAATTQGLPTTKHGTVVADEQYGNTPKVGVWAGGDIVTGSATVISAMGAGRRAASAIDRYLKQNFR